MLGGTAVKNKVTVSIAGQNYTLVASEDAGYMEKVAAHVSPWWTAPCWAR